MIAERGSLMIVAISSAIDIVTVLPSLLGSIEMTVR